MKKDEADPLIKLMMPNLIEARKSHGKCKRERRRVLSGLKEILRECLDTFDELALRKMKHKLTKFDAYKSVNRAHKDLHGRISRVRKVVQSVSVRKGLDSGEDSSIATRDEDTIEPLVERSIVKHLRRTGQRDVADTLLRDHDEKDEEDKDRFAKLVKLMEACESRDLSFLLRWTSENSDAIRDGALYSDIEFRLQSMKFREIAREKSATDAIQYARTEMRMYCKHAPGKMQELMTSLLFLSSSDGEEEEEEKDIVNNDDATWTCIREDIRKCACKLMGIPFRCPLRTAVQAGILVTPTLKKFKSVVRDSAYVLFSLSFVSNTHTHTYIYIYIQMHFNR